MDDLCSECYQTPSLSCRECHECLCRECFDQHFADRCYHCDKSICRNTSTTCFCGLCYCNLTCQWAGGGRWTECKLCEWTMDCDEDWCSVCIEQQRVARCRLCQLQHCRDDDRCVCKWLRYRRAMLVLVLASKRRRRQWLPTELFSLIMHEFIPSGF
jgi:hypothetical protein